MSCEEKVINKNVKELESSEVEDGDAVEYSTVLQQEYREGSHNKEADKVEAKEPRKNVRRNKDQTVKPSDNKEITITEDDELEEIPECPPRVNPKHWKIAQAFKRRSLNSPCRGE